MNSERVTMGDLFKSAFEKDYMDMGINEVIDVASYNIGIRSRNIEEDKDEYNRVNKIVRKKDSVEYVIKIKGGDKLSTSKNHRLYIRLFLDKKAYFEEVCNIIKIKTPVYVLNGDEWMRIQSITKTKNTIVILDLEVDKVNNYYSEGVLSHNTMFGNPEVVTGGKALKFFMEQRIRLYKSDKTEFANKGVTRVRAKFIKNKLSAPFGETEYYLKYGEGIDRMQELIDTSLELGVIKRAGSWYSYGETKLGQGETTVRTLLEDNEELCEEIEETIRQQLNIK